MSDRPWDIDDFKQAEKEFRETDRAEAERWKDHPPLPLDEAGCLPALRAAMETLGATPEEAKNITMAGSLEETWREEGKRVRARAGDSYILNRLADILDPPEEFNIEEETP